MRNEAHLEAALLLAPGPMLLLCVFWRQACFFTVSPLVLHTLFAGQRTRAVQGGLQGHFLLALRMFTVLKF